MSKLDELKEKFEGFVEDLKRKLPSKKGSNDEYDEEEDEDEFEESTSKVNVNPEDLEDEEIASETQTDVGSVPSSEDEEDDEDEDEEDEDDKKAKQKTWLIRGVIIALVGVLAFDFLMPSSEDNVVPEVPVVKSKRPKRPKRNRNIKNSEVDKPAPDTKVVEAAPEPVVEVAPVATPVVRVIPTPSQVEPVTIEVEPVEVAPIVEPEAQPTAPEAEPEPIAITEPEAVESIPPDTPNEVIEIEVPNTLELGENSNEEKPSLTMDEQVDKILQKSKDKDASEVGEGSDAIDPKMEYVSPPNYKRLGRGLIYNCIGKHWACVDKFSYFQCLENKKWSTTNSKNPECVTQNVYATDEDCAVVQTHYINTREATDFCDTQSPEDASVPSTKVVVP
jgi:hypothetical protein